MTSLGLAFFAKQQAGALSEAGLPDPAVLEVPAAEQQLVMYRFWKKERQTFLRSSRSRKGFAEVVELVDTLP